MKVLSSVLIDLAYPSVVLPMFLLPRLSG
jgi:hypothetical protein